MKNYNDYEKMPYILLEANKDFCIRFSDGAFDGHLEFSNDGQCWDEFFVKGKHKAQSVDGKLYIRGTGNT